jgi:hypothetical protein
VFLDEGVGSNFRGRVQLRRGMDNGGRMNHAAKVGQAGRMPSLFVAGRRSSAQRLDDELQCTLRPFRRWSNSHSGRQKSNHRRERGPCRPGPSTTPRSAFGGSGDPRS